MQATCVTMAPNSKTPNITDFMAKCENNPTICAILRLLLQKTDQQNSMLQSKQQIQQRQGASRPPSSATRAKNDNISPKKRENAKKSEKSEKGVMSLKEKSQMKRKKKQNRPKLQPIVKVFSKNDYQDSFKTITTPDWVDISQGKAKRGENRKKTHATVNEKMHQRLEICECRIIYGNTKYKHPAYSIQLEKDEKDLVPTESEKTRIDNYKVKEVKQTVPLFWEARPWDNQSDILSKEESDSIQEKIQKNIIETTLLSEHSYPVKYKSSNPKRTVTYQTPRKTRASPINSSLKATELDISNLFYGTDDSCDETDDDFF